VEKSEQIAIGVIGTGGMGGMHASNLHSAVADARLAAVSDVDAARAEKLAEKSRAAVFQDGVDLIRDDGVEAVVIASPDPTHAPLVLECLKSEKPVLCEKPLADSADAALKVVEAEVELGKKLVQVGFMRRYDPQHVAVKEAVASGAVGTPVLFRGWHRNADLDPGITSEWRTWSRATATRWGWSSSVNRAPSRPRLRGARWCDGIARHPNG
jgi:myo-inositol 2-dehydrogenase/D-chiro-inositol 1-dehydrogenase